MDEDSALLRQFIATRDEKAFAELVRRHVDLVYAAARRQLRDTSAAEDVTQQVFVLLAHKARTIRDCEAVAGWLLATTRYVSLNWLRTEARRRRHESEAAMTYENRQVQQSPAWEQVRPLLDEAVSTLKREDRDAVALRYFQGRSVADVAAAMGVSQDAAQKRLGRALERLREWFARRGVKTSGDALSSLLLANAVVVAPAALGTSVAGAALAAAAAAEVGIAGASTSGVGKAAVILMATAKTKLTVACATGVVLASITGTIAYQHLTTPGGRGKQVRVDPAATQPAEAAPPRRPGPPDHLWKPRFQQVYGLAPGQIAKRVAPPFIPEREQSLLSTGMNEGMLRRGARVTLHLEDFGGEVRWLYAQSAGPDGARFALKRIAGLPLQNIDLPPALANAPLPGDWVVRHGASEEERVAAVSAILSADTAQPGQFVRKQLEREAIVATGEFKIAPATQPDFTIVHFYVGNLDRNHVSMSVAQNPADMLMQLGELTSTPVVIESKLDGQHFTGCQLHRSLKRLTDKGKLTGAQLNEVLGNVAKQTGLTLTRQKRVVPIWVWETG